MMLLTKKKLVTISDNNVEIYFFSNILDPKTLGLKKCKNEQMSLEQMLSEQMSQAP